MQKFHYGAYLCPEMGWSSAVTLSPELRANQTASREAVLLWLEAVESWWEIEWSEQDLGRGCEPDGNEEAPTNVFYFL